MIRSSALLTVVAMAMLVAGVFSANLGLIYASIAVSILAALTLGVGVLLRRRELFGGAAAGDIRPGRAAADVAGTRSAAIPSAGIQSAGTGTAGAAQAAGAGQAADDRPRTDPGTTGDGGEKDGDLAEGPRKAASGAGPGAGRWPGSIAAKGASVTGRRGGEHSAAHAAGRGRSARPAPGTGQSARDPAAQAPAPREPGRESAGRERPGSGRERERERPGQDRDHAAAQADRAGRDQERDRGQDRDAAAQADRDQPTAGRQAAAWGNRDHGAQERDQAAAAPQAEAFRLPSADERAARARGDVASRGRADSPAADDNFWDRVSEELSGSGSQGPVRPAWPATAGPRAMGAGSAAKYGSPDTEDGEPEAAWSSARYRQAGPTSWDGQTARPTGRPEDDEQAEGPAAGESGGTGWSHRT